DRHECGGEPIADPLGNPAPEIPAFPGHLNEAAKRVIESAMSVSADPDSLFVGLFASIAAEETSHELALLRAHYEDEIGRGGAVALGIDLLNAAGVPARLAYGVRLEEARGGQEAVRLVEYFDGAYWKVRDPGDPGSTLDP